MTGLPFRRALTLFATLSVFLSGNGVVTSREANPELQAVLKKLEGATGVTLMIIPRLVAFRYRVDESRLPRVSCVYEIRAEHGGSALKDLLNIFNNSFLEFQTGYQSLSEVRIGIIFKDKDEVLQKFYFEDWGGVHNIHGLTEPTRILTSPDFANQLRALVKNNEIELIESNNHSCPRA
jgi:hypothetical protein